MATPRLYTTLQSALSSFPRHPMESGSSSFATGEGVKRTDRLLMVDGPGETETMSNIRRAAERGGLTGRLNS